MGTPGLASAPLADSAVGGRHHRPHARSGGRRRQAGRADAMVRVFGFIQKQVPLSSTSGRGLSITLTNQTPKNAGRQSQMTITSPTSAQGEDLGPHWTLTVDPRTGKVVEDGYANWTTHPNNPGRVAAE